MSWTYNHVVLGHDTFIVFVELKMEGLWHRDRFQDQYDESLKQDVLSANDSEKCFVHLIEPDGLRRIFQFTKGATINVHQNVLSYHSGQIIGEHSVDEEAQFGKRKTRDML